eukprot:TRINITY_DN513679_c0_g1_i1.p1 TRINITY_DN513679_c0_g1~~TRINITY_DN513679_c0_g1_i1.p1  ORF type:complete len:573 (+),score=169.08 TRINITY_DN513679_c0_g1_i1:211-1719(+)
MVNSLEKELKQCQLEKEKLIQENNNANSSVNSELESLKNTIEELRKELAKCRKECLNKDNLVNDTLKRLKLVNQRMELLEAENDQTNKRAKDAKYKLIVAEGTIKELEEKLGEFSDKSDLIESLKEKAYKAEQDSMQLRFKLRECEDKLSGLQSLASTKNSDLESQIVQLKSRISTLEGTLDRERLTAMNRYEDLKGSSEKSQRELMAEIETLRRALTGSEKEVQILTSELEELRSKTKNAGSLQKMMEGMKRELAMKRAEVDRLNALAGARQAKTASLEQEIRKLKEQITRQQSAKDLRSEINRLRKQLQETSLALSEEQKRAEKLSHDLRLAESRNKISASKNRPSKNISEKAQAALSSLVTALTAELKAKGSVQNIEGLLKAAEVAEMSKARDMCDMELKSQKQINSVLLYSCVAGESQVDKFDAHAANKLRRNREMQIKEMDKKLEQERKDAKSYDQTSSMNTATLNMMLKNSRGQLKARTSERQNHVSALTKVIASA